MALRKQMLDELEEKLIKDMKSDDGIFYYHPNEDNIIISHALFWVMSRQ